MSTIKNVAVKVNSQEQKTEVVAWYASKSSGAVNVTEFNPKRPYVFFDEEKGHVNGGGSKNPGLAGKTIISYESWKADKDKKVVKCVNKGNFKSITKGKIYVVRAEVPAKKKGRPVKYEILDDFGKISRPYSDRFVDAYSEEAEEEKSVVLELGKTKNKGLTTKITIDSEGIHSHDHEFEIDDIEALLEEGIISEGDGKDRKSVV